MYVSGEGGGGGGGGWVIVGVHEDTKYVTLSETRRCRATTLGEVIETSNFDHIRKQFDKQCSSSTINSLRPYITIGQRLIETPGNGTPQ